MADMTAAWAKSIPAIHLIISTLSSAFVFQRRHVCQSSRCHNIYYTIKVVMKTTGKHGAVLYSIL